MTHVLIAKVAPQPILDKWQQIRIDRGKTIALGSGLQHYGKRQIQFPINNNTNNPQRNLESYLPELSNVAFYKGLGTLHDKALRIETLATVIAPYLDAVNPE